MSVGPLGIAGSAAGSPLSQTRGADVEKAAQDTADQSRETQTSQRAEKASGIGETHEDEQASDRDADGRRPWEAGGQAKEPERDVPTDDDPQAPPQSKDPTGQKGNQLDLSG
jgi:hypothetical protein